MNPNPLKVWHRLVHTQDASGLNDLLADDVIFYSPVLHTPQRGKVITTAYLAAAFQVFFSDSFRYTREIVGLADALLEFETRIDGIDVNGIDLMSWNQQGQITEFKVMVRPLKAVNLIHQKMAVMLAAAPRA